MMGMCVKVKYEGDDTPNYFDFKGRAYTYRTDIELNYGDIVYAPTAKGMKKAIVESDMFDEEEVSENIRPLLKTITEHAPYPPHRRRSQSSDGICGKYLYTARGVDSTDVESFSSDELFEVDEVAYRCDERKVTILEVLGEAEGRNPFYFRKRLYRLEEGGTGYAKT